MTARLILPPGADQTDRETWLAERRKGITASEIAALLGISPFQSPFNLYWQKRGEVSEDFDSDRLELGRVLEPYTASRYRKAHPEFILTAPAGLWQSTERPWQLATPDGLLHDAESYGLIERGGVFEIEPAAAWEGKTSATYEDWGEDGSDEIPAYIRAQALWQLDVMGLEIVHVSCLFLITQKVRTYVVAYDTTDVELMRKRALEFLARLEAEDPPPIDSHPATTAALKALYPKVEDDEEATIRADVAEAYRWTRASLTAAKIDAAEAENLLRAEMGAAKVAVDPDGERVCSRSIYERTGVDTERLRTQHPEAYADCRTTSTVDRLNPTRKKKEPTS